jgi:hypothetical protein
VVVDYEAAWVAFMAHIAGKSQHGRAELLEVAATTAADNRVPAGEVARLLRLHGVEVQRAHSTFTNQADAGAFGGGHSSPLDAGSPTSIDRGDHDGHPDAEPHSERRRRAA